MRSRTTFSHYRVVAELGAGGMGVVYRAEDIRLQRPVALKFLPPEVSGQEEAKERFLREARAASALDHPNICTIYEIGETSEGQLFLAMAWYEGETLKKKIERGPLALDEAIGIVRQIATGLARAHGGGIVHRDIKPPNVFLAADGEADRVATDYSLPGQVKILDFGLAKVLGGVGDLTRTGSTRFVRIRSFLTWSGIGFRP